MSGTRNMDYLHRFICLLCLAILFGRHDSTSPRCLIVTVRVSLGIYQSWLSKKPVSTPAAADTVHYPTMSSIPHRRHRLTSVPPPRTPVLPPDITFKIVDDTGSWRIIHGEVKAHRYLLVGSSRTFRKMLRSALSERGGMMVYYIHNTTIEAFTTMIDYIYRPPGPDTFSLDSITDPLSLCEILNLAELYHLTELRKLVEDALKVEAIKLMEREYRILIIIFIFISFISFINFVHVVF